AAAFPPYDLGWLAWVALVPLCVAAATEPPRTAFRLGYCWGLVAFGGVLWWLVAFGPVVWALAVALVAVFPGAATGIAAWAQRERGRTFGLFWMPLVWVVVEFVRSQGPLGFPWALAGESQHRALVVAQIASITGVWGVSFVVVLANALLADVLGRRGAVPALAAAAALIAGTIGWGWSALQVPAARAGVPGAVTAAVVQPDAPPRGPTTPSDARAQLAVLETLTNEAASRGAQLVVWPETAFPTDITGDAAARARIGSWTRRSRVALIASSLEGGTTDSAFAFSPAGVLVGRYDKMHLVPFAEFGEHAGRTPGVLSAPSGPVGIAICFESVFPDIARRTVLGGADLLAVLTNDAWFSGPAAAEQHAAAAAFRAIEEGRYLLRAANSGISEIIDPHGRVVGSLPLGARGVLVSRVAATAGLTPYARYGDLFPWTAIAAGTVLLVRRALSDGMPAADPALVRLLTVSAVPLLAIATVSWGVDATRAPGLLVAGAPVPLPVLAVLAANVLFSVGRPVRSLGFQAAGFVPAAAAGLAVVGVVVGVAAQAFAAQGAPVSFVSPPGGWWAGSAVQVLVVGLTFEWWLRGLVYDAALAWRGWRVAVAWSAVLGLLAASPRGAEAMVWSCCAGLAFGAIRTRWPQVPALAVAHGAGAVFLGFLLSPW
ncbi:MAG TPA: apolipoprotein N-acyltransferase, partial [bacterium]|nr:apolipoprotein N-acyltransferase [bacterium]